MDAGVRRGIPQIAVSGVQREIEFVAQLVDHVGNSADGAAAFEAWEIKSGTNKNFTLRHTQSKYSYSLPDFSKRTRL